MRNATSTRSMPPESTTKVGGTMRSLVVLVSVVAFALGSVVGSADDTDIQFDTTATANTGTTQEHTLSIDLSVGNNSNRYLALGVSLAADSSTFSMPTVKTATWTVGGTVQSLAFRLGQTATTGSNDTARSEVWQVVAPTSGAGTIDITLDTRTVSSETVVLSTSTTGVTNVPSMPGPGESLGTGDGIEDSFNGTLTNTQVVRNTLTILAGGVTATDDGSGVLTGTDVDSGSIDYDTGAWSITYDAPPGDGTPITANYSYGKWSFTGTLADPAVDPLSLTFSATVGSSTKTASDNGSGSVTGDSGNITGSIVYASGLWTLDFMTPPDASTTITAAYDHLNEAQMVAGGVSFHNVHQTNPSPAGSTNNGTDDRATSSVSGRLRDGVFGVVATTGPANTLTPMSYMTEQWKNRNGSGNTDAFGAGATAANTDDESTTMRWDFAASRNWAIAVIGIKPPNTPTEARFAKARAYATESGMLVTWRTAYEVRNLGFKVYREDDHGNPVLLNRSIVAGSALFAGPAAELSVGRSYVFWDADSGRGVNPYWLESVDLDGSSTWYGPFLSEPASETRAIQDLGGISPSEARIKSNPSVTGLGRNESNAVSVVKGFGTTARRSINRVGGSQMQWRLADSPAAKILVDQAGWARVTRAQLAAAGYDPGPDATGLQLINQGHEKAVRITGQDDGYLDMEDAIEFFAEEIDTPSSGTNVYWLTNRGIIGRRISEVSASAGGGNPVSTYPATVTLQDRSLYVAAVTNNGERDNFYGSVVGAEPVSQILDVDALPSEGGQQPATLEVALQGLTTSTHRVAVSFNGHELEEMEFTGDVGSVRSYQIESSWLRIGDNEVVLEALDGDADVSVTDYLRLTWHRPFLAVEDRLEMTAASGATVRVSGFSEKTIRLFDLTNRHAPVEIIGAIEQDVDGSWAVEIVLAGSAVDGDRDLYAVAENGIESPAGLQANAPSMWHAQDNNADMVIISHSDLLPSAEQLAAYRSAHGVATVALDVADIYDEFSWGIKDPNAIRAFLSQAVSAWGTAPRYVLLVGDASFDPRNYMGFGDRDLVPTKILATNLFKTANDDWFADLDGNGMADLAVGRLPAGSLEGADAMVAKIIGYEQDAPVGSWVQSLSLVADAPTADFDFQSAVDALEDLVPGYIASDRIDLGDVGPSEAHQLILDAFDEGRVLVNYTGHGSQAIWASDEVFENEDALNLENGFKLPLVVAMNCLNGLFHDVYQDGLAEALLKNPNGGAVMVWASSALTDPTGQDLMNQDLYRSLFGGDNPSVGDAVLEAKANVTDRDTRNSWILFGDPSMRLKQ